MFSRFTKKLTAVLASLAVMASMLPTGISPAQAVGSVQTTYDFSALAAGHGLNAAQFHHDYLNTDTNTASGGADGDGVSGGFPDGNYTLTVAPATIPAGFAVGNNPHPIPFTITPAGTAMVTIAIIAAGGGGGGAPATGSVQTTYDFSALAAGHGLNSAQFHHDYFNTDTNTASGGADGDGVSGGLTTGNYTLTVDPATIPAGFTVGNNPHPIPFTVTAAATSSVTISIIAAGGGAGGGAGTGSVQTTYDFSALAAGHGLNAAQFHHDYFNTDTNTASGGADGDGVSGGLTTGNYTLTVDAATIPAGFAIGNNPHPIPFVITNAGATQVTINIVTAGGGGGGGAGTGSIQTTYDFSALAAGHGLNAAQFHHDYFNTDTNTASGGADGDGVSGGLTTGNYTLTVDPATIPAGFVVGNNPNAIPFAITNGGTTQVTINIVTAGGGGGGQFIISQTNGLQTSEDGTTDQFTVALVNNPTGNVTIAVSSSNTNEGTVSTNTLTFTPANGTNPQTIVITGVDDAIADGAIPYTIILASAVSTDANFSGLDPTDISVTNLDNDGGNNGGGGGGGGGGRRRFGTPTITFIKDGQNITELTLARGEDSGVTVSADDGRGGVINLSLFTDPTENTTTTASFTVADQDTSAPVGTLTWTPDDEDTGEFDFVFQALGSVTTQETLKITVVDTVAPPSTGGGGGGGGGGGSILGETTIEERVESCEYSDNKTESVVYLCLLGIIDPPNDNDTYNGQSKNKRYFGRDQITRAAFTKIMVNITYEDGTIQRVKELINKNEFYAFPDVEPIAWFSRFITVAKLDDHVHGYPDLGLFVPWGDIEISEAVKILFNTARHDNEKIQSDLSEAEADVGEDSAWFMKFAALAYKYGGYTPDMNGTDPGDIYSKKLSRQQAANIIYTTIQNAGIQPKSHVSALKEDLIKVQEEIEDAEIDLELDPVSG